MAADVTANVFPSVHLSKMLIFRGYFHIVNRRTLSFSLRVLTFAFPE